jgi:hypothetical protein
VRTVLFGQRCQLSANVEREGLVEAHILVVGSRYEGQSLRREGQPERWRLLTVEPGNLGPTIGVGITTKGGPKMPEHYNHSWRSLGLVR